VVVENQVGDRVDTEAVEHAEADMRMALEHESLRVGQCTGLPQDLLRNRQLAQVVEAAGQPGQLDLLRLEAEAGRDARGEVAHAFGMAAGVGVTCVDRLRK
jgi:hypothetical protein